MHYVSQARDIAVSPFVGYGAQFFGTTLFAPFASGWRVLLPIAVAGLWFTYPEAGDRARLSGHYGYGVLPALFVCFPFALKNLGAGLRKLLPERLHRYEDLVLVALPVCLCGYLVWQDYVRVDLMPSAVARSGDRTTLLTYKLSERSRKTQALIDDYIEREPGTSIMAGWTSSCYVPYRREMFLLYHDWHRFVRGEIRPDWLLVDLKAREPAWPDGAKILTMNRINSGGDYERMYGEDELFLFRRRK